MRSINARLKEVARLDEYVQYTLYGTKPDTAKPPYQSVQIREDEVGVGRPVNGIRMSMFYYNGSGSAGIPPGNTSGNFDYNYTEVDKCDKPFGGPTWCMPQKRANATYRAFNYPHQCAVYWSLYTTARHFDHMQTRMPSELFI